ncbi:hypothetical protein [Methylophaga sp. UBA678]|uniref:hypothetical protein n=1 Tax=Methylophaga sp. UBA678 TaxID=1946901 RepID=UPI0039C93BF4
MKWLLLIVLVVVAVKQCQHKQEVSLGPGVKVAQAPVQSPLSQAIPFKFEGYQITPLAYFSLQAKVLGREDYRLDRESDLSPTDLALGWLKMSDENVLANIDISQSGRWYYWQVQQFPIPRREIETQSANMHLIPADNEVGGALKRVRKGQIIALEGQLIQAKATDGWSWKSSMTRDDTGAHACEVVYVTSFKIIE